MKKTLSILLSLLMVISVTFGMDFSALAEDDVDDGVEITYNTSYLLDTQNHVLEIDADGGETGTVEDFMSEEDINTVQDNNYSLIVKNATVISDYAFSALNIKNVKFDDKLEEIGNSAFSDNETLEGVIDTLNVKTIGGRAFDKCEKITGLITKAESIGSYAFANNYSLENVSLKDTSRISSEAFMSCESLVNFEFPKSTTYIGNGVFADCKSLKSIIIPNGCSAYIGDRIARYCNSLVSMYIPADVTKVGEKIFDLIPNKTAFAVITTEGSYIQEFAKSKGINCNTNGGKVTVTFDGNSFGTCSETTRQYNIGDVYGALPKAESDDRAFVGWTRSDSYDDILDSSQLIQACDHTLYAVYDVNTYNITLDPNGGVIKGDYKTVEAYPRWEFEFELPTPTKEGYIFIGWFDSDDKIIKEDTKYNYGSDITLTAKYKPIEYTLNLYVGDNIIDTVSLKYDEYYTLPSIENITPEENKSKYFLGWSVNNNTKPSYNDAQTIKNLTSTDKATVNLYARWTSYSLANLNEQHSVSLSSSGSNANRYQIGYSITKDGNYKFKLNGVSAKVTIKTVDGKEVASVNNQNITNSTNILLSLEKDLYVVTIETGKIPCEFNYILNEVNTAIATFDANGGTLDITSKEFAIGDEYGNDLPIPAKTGYNFYGWYDSNDNEVSNADIVTGNITLKAKWNPIKYKVVYFNEKGQKISQPQEFTYDKMGYLKTAESLGIADAKENCVFIGWTTAINKTEVEYKDGAEMFNERSTSTIITLYPIYVPHISVVSIYYCDTDGRIVATKKVNNNALAQINPNNEINYSKTGYTLEGWTDTMGSQVVKYANGDEMEIATTKTSISLYAVVAPITYRTNFYDINGNIAKTYTVVYDIKRYTPVYKRISNLPSNFRNAGWSTTPNSDTVEYKENQEYINLTSVQDGEINFYPVIKKSGTFTVNMYQYGKDGTLRTEDYLYDDDVFEVPSPVGINKEYVDKYFVGWSLNPDSKNPDYTVGQKVSTDDINENITLYGIWSQNIVRVYFHWNYGNYQATTKYVPSNEKIGTLPTLNRDGYNFLGWFTEEDGGTEIDNNYIIDNGVATLDFYAHFEKIKNTYNVNIDDLGSDKHTWSDLTKEQKFFKVEENTDLRSVLPKDLKLTRFENGEKAEFLGWYTEPNLEYKYDYSPVNFDLDLYPLWDISNITTISVDHKEFHCGDRYREKDFMLSMKVDGKTIDEKYIDYDVDLSKFDTYTAGTKELNVTAYYDYGIAYATLKIEVKEKGTTNPEEPTTPSTPTEPTKPEGPTTPTTPTTPSQPSSEPATTPSSATPSTTAPSTTTPSGIGQVNGKDDAVSSSLTTTKAKAKKVSKPKKTSIKKLSKGKKKITVTYSKISGIKGYQVQVATDKKFKKNKKTVTIKKQKTTKSTVKKLKANRKYYVRVRTYKIVNGKKVYSAWSKVKTVKTK